VHELRQRRELPDGQRIRLTAPTARGRSLDPTDVLSKLWYAGASGRPNGQWVEFSGREYAAYALLNVMRRNGWRSCERARRILQYHPAWLAFSFVPRIDVDACCRLACLIIDPRWFVHPVRPNRLTKLYNYLGITPKNARVYGNRHLNVSPDRHHDRFKVICEAWLMPCEGGARDMDDPREFLSRVLCFAESPHRGLAAAAKRFAAFVHGVWWQGLVPDRLLFDPEMFFPRTDEVEAYREHCRQPLQEIDTEQGTQ
jgi:hypothetical protein